MNPRKRRMLIKQNIKRKKKRKVVFHQITRNLDTPDPFFVLTSIYTHGYKGRGSPNVFLNNAMLSSPFGDLRSPSTIDEIMGDKYSIEMKTRAKRSNFFGEAIVEHAFPDQIKKIQIEIFKGVNPQERQRRIEFYKKKFPKIAIVFT
ncbi:MAG: hypothetical protein V1847_05490 [Candidatus Diapherotrites archaeon]